MLIAENVAFFADEAYFYEIKWDGDLLGQALFRSFIFYQEAGPNSRYLCTFPARGELACREYSDH